jgi:hypothetical protein
MKNYISEGRAIYEDENHGQFSKRLAEWAISKMRTEDPATGLQKPIIPRKLDDVKEVLKSNKVVLDDEYCYTAWYLFNMAIADYPKTCRTDEQRASFVEETLCDPDGNPANTLDCFATKMCNAGVPIYWEEFL